MYVVSCIKIHDTRYTIHDKRYTKISCIKSETLVSSPNRNFGEVISTWVEFMYKILSDVPPWRCFAGDILLAIFFPWILLSTDKTGENKINVLILYGLRSMIIRVCACTLVSLHSVHNTGKFTCKYVVYYNNYYTSIYHVVYTQYLHVIINGYTTATGWTHYVNMTSMYSRLQIVKFTYEYLLFIGL